MLVKFSHNFGEAHPRRGIHATFHLTKVQQFEIGHITKLGRDCSSEPVVVCHKNITALEVGILLVWIRYNKTANLTSTPSILQRTKLVRMERLPSSVGIEPLSGLESVRSETIVEG